MSRSRLIEHLIHGRKFHLTPGSSTFRKKEEHFIQPQQDTLCNKIFIAMSTASQAAEF